MPSKDYVFLTVIMVVVTSVGIGIFFIDVTEVYLLPFILCLCLRVDSK